VWRSKAVWTVLIFACCQNGLAQDEPGGSLITNQPWVRFDLVLGRITAVHLAGGTHQRESPAAEHEVVRERLAVGSEPQPTLRYECRDARHELSIEVIAGDQVDIRLVPLEASNLVPLTYRQRPGSSVHLQVGPADASRTIAAPSVWHLCLAEPVLCRTHLLPVLRRLRADWQLEALTAEIERDLFRRTGAGDGVTSQQVETLVEELGARRFADRQAADRALRNLGVSVLCHLRSVDASSLDREQRQRIAAIQRALSPPIPDTPQRVAAWLQPDRIAWLALMSHDEPAKREWAAQRLAETSLAAVHFDAQADEGERREQIARLRSHFERR